MALPQLPAHVVHKLGQHSRVIQEFLSTENMQKRAVLPGRLSFVHAGYPIFKVHSADFFSNIFYSKSAHSVRVGEEIPLFARSSRVIYKVSALFVRVIKQLSTTKTTHSTSILRPSVATSALADAFYVHYSRMLFGYSCEKHPFF